MQPHLLLAGGCPHVAGYTAGLGQQAARLASSSGAPGDLSRQCSSDCECSGFTWLPAWPSGLAAPTYGAAGGGFLWTDLTAGAATNSSPNSSGALASSAAATAMTPVSYCQYSRDTPVPCK